MLMVSSELAIAQVLLVAAGLLVASFGRLVSVEPGFEPDNLVAMDVALPPAKYREPAQRIRFHEEVLARLEATPGVQSAAMGMRAPMTPAITRGVWIEGRPPLRPGEIQIMSFLTISEKYFTTAGMPLIRGRGITPDDGPRGTEVVVVNEAFGRRYFPGQDPIGKRIGYGAPGGSRYWRTIVGLVGDTREHLAQPPPPTAYAPFRQDLEPWNFASYLVRSSLPLAVIGEAGRQAVMASDPNQPVSRLRPVEADMRATIAMQRFTTMIAAMFAGIALVLAVVGTFGVMSHVVRGRAREIGVRIALGATRHNIVVLVLGQASKVVLAAILVGLGAALLLGTSIQALLYEVRPRDPQTMALAASVLLTTALAASYVPIRRVLARNPVASLRDS